jgi:hypothetical protein
MLQQLLRQRGQRVLHDVGCFHLELTWQAQAAGVAAAVWAACVGVSGLGSWWVIGAE